MKAVIIDVPESLIEDRRRKGLDRRDELWEGVYHMVPPPSEEHQVIVDGLFILFGAYFGRHSLGTVRSMKGIRDSRSAAENYRIPEWIALRVGREGLLKKKSGYVDEGPDVAVEVRSPGDETDEKIPFYEKVGVQEVLIVDRDTRRVEVLRRTSGRLLPVSPAADGWTRCEGLRAFFRAAKAKGKSALLVKLELDGTEHAI